MAAGRRDRGAVGAPGTPHRATNWLSASADVWASEHREVLEAIYERFDASGEWPDPVQVQRELRAAERTVPVARLVTEMPGELGRRDYEPPRAVLGLFGIACCPAAWPLLDNYFGTLVLALERHSQPDLPNRLSRQDLTEALRLSEHEASRLSAVIAVDCPFLGAGTSGMGSWDREIDERVVDYEAVPDIDGFLTVLAEQRGHLRQPSPQVPEDSPETQPSRDLTRLGRALGAVVGAAGLLFTVAGTAPALVAGVVGAFLAVGAFYWLRPGVDLPGVLAGASVAAIVIGVAAHFLLGTESKSSKAPSIGTQLDAVVAQARGNRQFVATRRSVRLHGAGRPSHVLILRDISERDLVRDDLAPRPPSDEIRIYDEVRGRLVLRFRFQAQNAGEVQQPPDGDFPSFLFRLETIEDLDRDGSAEVLGGFERVTLATGALPVPVAITWDPAPKTYRLTPLIQQPPDLKDPLGYSEPTVIQDQHSENVIRGYPADAFDVRMALRAPVLLAAYFQLAPRAVPGYEVKAWFVDLGSATPQINECGPRSRHVIVTPDTPAGLPEAMADAVIGRHNEKWCGAA